ncbi:MAG: gamma-glutamyltransferase family protein [Acidobacteria bacterium]|nr:gamma-glutamyltransferase family protein [Acidobacteriota bacterium]
MKPAIRLLASLSLIAQSRDHGRATTISKNGIVATSQTLASQAGAEILARGGSAVDAAIAANAVLSVVEPMMDGIGGDLFAMVWTASDKKLSGLNASGWAAKAQSIGAMKKLGFRSMPQRGIHTVTVPGAAAGWAAMHARYGRLPWRDLFRAAIYYAREGFPVTERIQQSWGASEATLKSLRALEAAPEIFLPGGKPPAVGQVFKNPMLARAFTLLAAQGPDVVYRGEIAKAILATSKKLGGMLDARDLAEWTPEWVTPISSTYRGWRLYELPPNGSGIGAIEMLNMIETRPLEKKDAAAYHWQIEAMKLAYADLWQYSSDPRFVDVPMRSMLSKEYAAKRASAIDMAKAKCDVAPGVDLITSGNTTYLAVVDKEGNIASWIQSISAGWGSAVAVDGMGFHLQNRGSYFKLDAKHANALAPRKRPQHTIIPAFLEKGDLHVGFGIMGGPTQPYSHAQFVSNIADFGMNIQAAMDAPRFAPTGSTCTIAIESRVPAAVRGALTKLGHKLNDRGAFATSGVGVGQAVMRDQAVGVNYGASDARGDGAAIPESPRYD